MRRASLPLLVSLLALAVVPARAGAPVAPGLACNESFGFHSRVSRAPLYDVLPGELTVLESDHDGDTIQVGVVRPAVPDGTRVPVIVRASPYFRGGLGGDLHGCDPWLVENFVPQGYAVAFIPVRGTADSGACFDLMGAAERSDLDQAVRWLGERPWSSGTIGMIGLSYDGSTPWEVAAAGNPYLKTIVPISGVQDLYDLMHHSGVNEIRGAGLLTAIYYLYGFQQYNVTTGRSAPHMATGIACPEMMKGLAADAYSTLTGERDPAGFFSARNSRPGVEARYAGSVLMVQGLQDWNVNPQHTLPWMAALEERGIPVWYLLGQWAHAVPDWPGNGFAHREDWADMLLNWFDRWLKNDAAVDLGPRVQVQDSDMRWRAESAWPPSSRAPLPVFLDDEGRLGAAPGPEGARTSVPAHTAPFDPQRCACEEYAIFRGERASEPVYLTGMPVADLTVVPSGPGGHLTATLYAEAERLRVVGWGQADLRFPEGGETARPVVPGQPLRLRIPLEPLDAVLATGHRLVLVLSLATSADHAPSVPTYPSEILVGGDRSVLHLEAQQRAPGKLYAP